MKETITAGRLGPEETIMARISSLSCITPEHQSTGEEVAALLRRRLPAADRSRLIDALERSASRTRHTALPLAELPRLGGIGERSALARRHAGELALRAVARLADQGRIDARAISKVIFVSATAPAIPSIDTDVIRRFGLDPGCRRVALSQLGCAGGAAALALAAESVRQPGDAALVVSAEVPSLHLSLAEPSVDEWMAAMQFGDGAAAAVVGCTGEGVEVVATASELLPEVGEGGSVLMHEGGLRLRTGGDLPALIRRRVGSVLDGLLERQGVASSRLDFVVAHPRGPRVLDAIADGLALEPSRIAGSRTAWEKYGNMISASLFAALAESARRASASTGGLAATIAFGAGTSCETALLRWEQPGDLTRLGQLA